MIQFLLATFWIGVAVVVYTYLGYGLLLLVLSRIKKPFTTPKHQSESELPKVILLIPAFNEAQLIEEKIKNTKELDYPVDKIEIAFITDGSTDNSTEIIKKYKGIQLFHSPERKGKIHAVNRVMKMTNTPIIVFCDANTLLNKEALRNIVRHYQLENVSQCNYF